MAEGQIERLLDLFDVRIDATCVCDIAEGTALSVGPLASAGVYFALSGEGLVETAFGRRAMRRGSVLVIPRGLAISILGTGPIREHLDAEHHRPLEDGVPRSSVGTGEPCLTLGCASVQATIGGVIDVFEHLGEPMVDDGEPSTTRLLDHILDELAYPQLGSRTLVEGLVKTVLIAVFRRQLAAEAFRNWLWPAMLNPQLGRAALIIMSRPQDPHTVECLAAAAGLSRSRFTEAFAQSFGRSPMEFVQVVRLRAAKRLLRSSALPVKSVAAAVGYASRSHFSRAFHAEFGDSPASFRMQQIK